jgi:RNA polymerase sigma-70 factor (ECF subfamily)
MVIRVPDQRKTPGGYAALDDRLLVLDFQAGNPQAFVEIHRRYGGLARHVCQRFLPQQPDVEEAFQETMIRVFQGLYRFNGRYALQPWIARIAKNVSLDILRGHARRPQTDASAPASDELPVPGDQADEIVERLVQRDTVLSVMADLPETHRRALMLREFEGRSHREVAQEMEISPSQAKALIHRAKGSFRRLWLEKVADRGGLMGFAFLPLLWLAQALNGLRRVSDRVGFAAQSAQAAVPEAVTSAVSTTAAPVASSGVGERLVAAGVTLLLAGGVTVGAAKIVSHRADEEPLARAEVTAAPAPVVTDHRIAPPVDENPRVEATSGKHEIEAELPIVLPDPSPAVEPSPAPVVETPPGDTEPSPTPSPDPSPAPAPAWSFELTSSTESVETCSCPPTGELVGSQLDRAQDGFTFSQSIRGGTRDSAGDLTWPFSLLLWGEVRSEAGQVDFRLTLTSGAGNYLYRGSGILAEVSELEDGAAEYRFDGTFERTNGRQPVAGLPSRGFVSATLRVWPDGTIYAGSLALEDVPA